MTTDTQTSPGGAASTRPLAVVTGASTGIGHALAEEFVEHGFDVAIVAEENAIQSVAIELGRGESQVTAIQVDLSTPTGVEELYANLLQLGRVPEAVALNVGVGAGGNFDEIPLEDDLRVIDINVRSTVHLAKHMVQDMVAAGRGRILITSSIAAVAPGPYHATYAASKAFVHSFGEAIREELKETGVTVTSLMPGPTDTEFFARAGMLDTPVGSSNSKDDPREVARDGYEALMAGKASVVAGSAKNKIQAELGTHLPDALAAPIMARLTKPQ